MSADDARAFYATLPGYQFDLEKAKAELAQSAHAGGFEITVPGSSADPYMINILQSVSENLKQIGITMKVQEIDANQWLAGYFRHENLGMQIMAYYPDFADAANYPYPVLRQRQRGQGRDERLELQERRRRRGARRSQTRSPIRRSAPRR